MGKGRFLQFFNKSNAFYAYFAKIDILKQAHQLKAFEKQSKRTK